MGLEVEKGLELFFQNNGKKLSFIIFFCFLCYSLFLRLKNICNPPIRVSNDRKITQFD
jgi:hypothetical protein